MFRKLGCQNQYVVACLRYNYIISIYIDFHGCNFIMTISIYCVVIYIPPGLCVECTVIYIVINIITVSNQY